MEEELIETLECPCGTIFEPEDLEVDENGERWARCPSCKLRILIPTES